MARIEKWSETRAREAMSAIPGWTIARDAITRKYTFAGFKEAIAFVHRVAAKAEEAGHHPDIDIRYNQVTLTLSSHDAGGITHKDFDLARAIDKKA